jgi:hypothetical protein
LATYSSHRALQTERRRKDFTPFLESLHEIGCLRHKAPSSGSYESGEGVREENVNSKNAEARCAAPRNGRRELESELESRCADLAAGFSIR